MPLDFTPNCPPKSGKAFKLWKWYIAQTGEEPRVLAVIRPRQWRFEAGAARYIINNSLYIYDADDAVKRNIGDAISDPIGLHLWEGDDSPGAEHE